MSRSTNQLIQEMADDLQPVETLRRRDGLLLVLAAALATVIAIEFIVGLWRGALTGEASAFYVLTNGLLLVLGCAASSSVLRMASPQVGNQHEGPRWASLAVTMLPVAALLALLGHDHPTDELNALYGLKCMAVSVGAASLIAAALFTWLRRGAPVSPLTAGTHLGIASTALGSAAYGLACPLDGTVHLGIWHVLPVVFGAIIGRYAVAPLLRW